MIYKELQVLGFRLSWNLGGIGRIGGRGGVIGGGDWLEIGFQNRRNRPIGALDEASKVDSIGA